MTLRQNDALVAVGVLAALIAAREYVLAVFRALWYVLSAVAGS